MKVLFLLKNTTLHERIGIMTLSSILKQNGHTVHLVITEKLNYDKCNRVVMKISPDILAYSVITGDHGYYINLNQMIRKNYKAFSVFGGPHPTFNPSMIEFPSVDAICRCEGDICFPQLLNRMEQHEKFYDTPNFWFKTDRGQIIKNEIGPLVKNLDDLPFPDRKLMYDADPALRDRDVKMFVSMRGCPYQCTYCFNHAYNKLTAGKGEVLRYRSVDNVINEIKETKRDFFIKRVFFYDDTFLLKPAGWLEEFADRYRREIGLPVEFAARADFINTKTVRLMRMMGAHYVGLGVECANNEIARTILKRGLTNGQIRQAVTLLHENKIKTMTFNLIGLPVDDPLSAAIETLDFNIELKPHFAFSGLLFPYSGTEIEQIAMKKGMLDKNFIENKKVPANQTESVLIFKSPKIRQQIINLSKLFGIIVQFQFLRPYTMFLISLPLTRFYTWIYFSFFGFKMFQPKNLRTVIKNIANYIVFYHNHVKQLKR